jgi:hypothetical protein
MEIKKLGEVTYVMLSLTKGVPLDRLYKSVDEEERRRVSSVLDEARSLNCEKLELMIVEGKLRLANYLFPRRSR